MPSNTVPYTIDNLYAGFGQCDGLVRDEGEQLIFEFQVRDSVAGILKTGIRRVVVPVVDLVSVNLTKGWLGTSWLGVKIIIQAARMEAFENLPGASQGRIELHIARKDRALAEKFVADLHEYEEAREAAAHGQR